MAIVDMSRIWVVGLQKEKQQMLRYLQKVGAVQIDDGSYLAEEEEWEALVDKDGNVEAARALEERLSQVGKAIAALSEAGSLKKGFFPQKKTADYPTQKEQEEGFAKAKEINTLLREKLDAINERNNLENHIETLLPWKSVPIPLSKTETKTAEILFGTTTKAEAALSIASELPRQVATASFELVSQDELQAYCALVVHKAEREEAMRIARDMGFSPASFPKETVPPAEEIKKCQAQREEKEKTRQELEQAIRDRVGDLEELKTLYDYYVMEKEEKEMLGRLVRTKKAFYFTGWVPTYAAEQICASLRKRFTCELSAEPGKREGEYPILFDNPRLVKPFESVTEQYSLPNPRNMDPNTILAVFYFVFFGMMLSDAVYGILLMAACGFIVWKYKPQGQSGKLISMIGLCGLSTFLWGAAYGGWMGDLFGIKGLVDPLNSIMPLLFLSFGLGVVHLFVGMGMKAYMAIRDGEWKVALFDVGFWYLLLIGLLSWLVCVMLGFGATIPIALSASGAVGLLLTQGREKKNFFGKLVGGLSSLYDVTSYVSDILSYSRLMALGISTGVIANVVNLLAGMCPPVINVVVILFGHTLNLGINTLGAYVHTSRLQYVEFFSKFYEGGGKPFVPFQIHTKYVTFPAVAKDAEK